jgi:hypothetical protein
MILVPVWQLLLMPESFSLTSAALSYLVFGLMNRILFVRSVGGEYDAFSLSASKLAPGDAVIFDVTVLVAWVFLLIFNFEVL